jgi:hypothetical protein
MNITTLEELEEALRDVLGDRFQIEQDNHGQLIVYTGLCQTDDGEIEVFLSDEDAEEDLDLDPDMESLEELNLDEEE